MNKDDINEIDEKEVDEWFTEEENDENEEQTELTTSKQSKEEDISKKYSNTQLRIVRTNLDYSIDYLKSSLGSSINLEPQYQRRSRWDIKKRSLLIESLLLNIPIPPIFLFEIEYGQYEVVDGRQRLETLKDYLENIFPLKNLTYWKELNGKKFNELPVIIQRGLLRRTISATVLLAETTRPEDSEIDVRMVLFNRLNTGGVQLNPQELRNALYGGHFNNLLFTISRTDLFTTVWNIPKKTPNEDSNPPNALINNALYKSMADCELVLRFFAIRETILYNLKGSLKSLLDKSMKKHKDDTKEAVEKSKILFNDTLNDSFAIFDSKPFVLPNLNKPSRALYDALMVAYSLLIKEEIDTKVNINNKLKESLSITKSYDILLGKGNSIEAIRLRIEEAKKNFNEIRHKMEYIYQEFGKDIEHLKAVLNLADSIKSFSARNNDPKIEIPENKFLELAENVHLKSREAHIGMVYIPGTIVLYLGGRFEYFIKVLFEELSMNIALKCKTFEYLPKEFKENLIALTSEVIKSPEKYGHSENGVKTFITNLSNNINGLEITDINTKCLSITSENMKPQILNEMFNRIGAKEIWTKLGQQAKLQTFFETADANKAQKDAMKFLNDFMDIRNKVAHPSISFQWPDTNTVMKHIEYFEVLGKLICDLASVYETSIVANGLDKKAKNDEKASSQQQLVINGAKWLIEDFAYIQLSVVI